MVDAQGTPAAKPGPFPEIPGYRIEAVIGRGSAGTVYRAVQLAVERKVALKVLHPELATRGRAVLRLQREARTTARLAHPGIVSAIDMGSANGLWWYAMELVDGPSLAEKLKRVGKLSEREALRIFIPLCEALEHAFEHGVVHRDIKPGNILLDGSGRARLVDLGLAFAEHDPALTAQGGTLGTPHYISPEQARDPSAADVRSDIWSLGATLYHCVCGRPPFAGESVAEILSGVLYHPIPDPTEHEPGLSRGLCLVLRKCLARDPARRFQHPRELREDLERIRERRAVSVKPSMLDPLAGARERRTRLLRWGAVVAGGAVLLALAILQPWRASGGARPGVQPVERHEALEELASLARGARREVAPALARLERLGPTIPPRFDERAQELRRELRGRYDAEVVPEARARFEGELERLWRVERDFVGALAWIESGATAELHARFAFDGAQQRELGTRFEFERRRIEVERDMNAAFEDLDQRVRDHYANQRVRERSDKERAEGRWRTARAVLQVSGAELIAESKLATAGFPPARVEVLAASLESNVVQRAIDALEEAWIAADQARADEVAQARETLLAGLDERKVVHAAAQLEARWNALLQRDRLVDGERLEDVSDRARLAYIAALADLQFVEGENLAADALLILEDNTRDLGLKWRERRFDEIVARLVELEDRAALQPVAEQVRRMLAEARVLEALMQRAARALEQLAASGASTELLIGSIPRSGRIEECNRVFERGFRFRPKVAPPASPPLLLCLRELPGMRATLLGRSELERLAGLDVAQPSAAQRFELALLRWHLGDFREAAQVVLDAPAAAAWAPLVPELTRRIAAKSSEFERADRDLAEQAHQLLIRVRGAERDPHAAGRTQLERIHELLTKYGDQEEVRAEAAWLRTREAEIARDVARSDAEVLQRVFAPSELELQGSDTARLRFDFGANAAGTFGRGEWGADFDSWIAPRPFNRADLGKDVWPKLVLQPPIDLTQALTFELELHQPRESGPPRLLALTVAGVHVVFVGPRQAGLKGRYKIGSGDPDAFARLIADVLDGDKGLEFDGFRADTTYRLKVELKQGRGEVVVSIDGRALDRESPRRPDLNAIGDKSIVIRSFEPVRILEATLRAGYAIR